MYREQRGLNSPVGKLCSSRSPSAFTSVTVVAKVSSFVELTRPVLLQGGSCLPSITATNKHWEKVKGHEPDFNCSALFFLIIIKHFSWEKQTQLWL